LHGSLPGILTLVIWSSLRASPDTALWRPLPAASAIRPQHRTGGGRKPAVGLRTPPVHRWPCDSGTRCPYELRPTWLDPAADGDCAVSGRHAPDLRRVPVGHVAAAPTQRRDVIWPEEWPLIYSGPSRPRGCPRRQAERGELDIAATGDRDPDRLGSRLAHGPRARSSCWPPPACSLIGCCLHGAATDGLPSDRTAFVVADTWFVVSEENLADKVAPASDTCLLKHSL
jgi:hypothetical protein